MTAIFSILFVAGATFFRGSEAPLSATNRSNAWMAIGVSKVPRLHFDSQGWKQTRPQTPGKGFSSLRRCHAPSTSPSLTFRMKSTMLFPAGHAALQGGVLFSYKGFWVRHVPV